MGLYHVVDTDLPTEALISWSRKLAAAPCGKDPADSAWYSDYGIQTQPDVPRPLLGKLAHSVQKLRLRACTVSFSSWLSFSVARTAEGRGIFCAGRRFF